ncbi:molybdopterin-dependent oxidoreductase [Kiloniella sp. b19]|uniref:molybdopterin-dependent oxidoreductase n=1 Tax=Kiloniella sp. GXU_MW_B19 TaxID=3141326 RepID=UPI0031DD1340
MVVGFFKAQALIIGMIVGLIILLLVNWATADAGSYEKLSVYHANDAGAVHITTLDRAAFRALPQTTLITTNPWYEGPQRFEGVLLRDFLELNELPMTSLRLIALNDYVVDLEISEVEANDFLIAVLHNGEEMSTREKGPFWLIVPDTYDQEANKWKMIWQLVRIDVKL